MKSEDSVVLPLPPFPTKAIFMFGKPRATSWASPHPTTEAHPFGSPPLRPADARFLAAPLSAATSPGVDGPAPDVVGAGSLVRGGATVTGTERNGPDRALGGGGAAGRVGLGTGS